MTREEAISRINNDLEWHKKELSAAYKTALNMAIEALKFCEVYDKTIEAVNKFYDDHHAQILGWIPCSERLPEYGEPVLTWDGYCYCVEKRIPYIRDECGEPISSDWWVSDEYDERESDYYPNLRDGACIAWMPLPEPYTEDKQ